MDEQFIDEQCDFADWALIQDDGDEVLTEKELLHNLVKQTVIATIDKIEKAYYAWDLNKDGNIKTYIEVVDDLKKQCEGER